MFYSSERVSHCRTKKRRGSFLHHTVFDAITIELNSRFRQKERNASMSTDKSHDGFVFFFLKTISNIRTVVTPWWQRSSVLLSVFPINLQSSFVPASRPPASGV